MISMNAVKMVDPIINTRKLKENVNINYTTFLYPDSALGDPNDCEEAILKPLNFKKNEGMKEGIIRMFERFGSMLYWTIIDHSDRDDKGYSISMF